MSDDDLELGVHVESDEDGDGLVYVLPETYELSSRVRERAGAAFAPFHGCLLDAAMCDRMTAVLREVAIAVCDARGIAWPPVEACPTVVDAGQGVAKVTHLRRWLRWLDGQIRKRGAA